MDTDAVVSALDCLEAAGIPAWVDGGRGIDALVGEQSRRHGDLDLAVARRTSMRHGRRSAISASSTTRPPGPASGSHGPARLRGRQIDLHPVVLDFRGNGWQPLGDGAWGAYPADSNDRHDLRLLAPHFGLALHPTADERCLLVLGIPQLREQVLVPRLIAGARGHVIRADEEPGVVRTA